MGGELCLETLDTLIILLETVVMESLMSDSISTVLLIDGTSAMSYVFPIGPLVSFISYLLAHNPIGVLFVIKLSINI